VPLSLPPRGSGLWRQFLDSVDKAPDVLKLAVHGGEAYIGDVVDPPEFIHYETSNVVTIDLGNTPLANGSFDPLGSIRHGLLSDGPLAARLADAHVDLLEVERLAASIPFADHDRDALETLIGGEALTTRVTDPPAARCRAIVGLASVYDPGIRLLAEWAPHR